MAIEHQLKQAPRRNWIRTPLTSVVTQQDVINIDFISKIRMDLTAFRVIVHHGVTGGTGYSGSTQAYACADAAETEVVFAKFFDAINNTGVLVDIA